jgi:soluble lytic murein transglycosylase-like protein
MKKVIILFSCILLLAFTTIEQIKNNTPIEQIKINPKPIVELSIKSIEAPKIKSPSKNHQDFLNAIGHQESRNRYNIVNRFGYMGKYQFGKRTLRGLGFKVDKKEFLNNPSLQEKAMHKLLQTNKGYLQKYIDLYEGQIVNGVLVTESGLLAAAHLGGAGSVKKWFKTGKVKKDGNGVKITSYMVQFGGYNLNLDYDIN